MSPVIKLLIVFIFLRQKFQRLERECRYGGDLIIEAVAAPDGLCGGLGEAVKDAEGVSGALNLQLVFAIAGDVDAYRFLTPCWTPPNLL